MQLHTLQPLHQLTDKKTRVGRGGKRGTTSGRGQKGQRAHAGRRIPSGLKEILQRLPKLRGYSNKPTSVKPITLNFKDLEPLLNKIKAKEEIIINKNFLVKEGLLKDARALVKILGDGEITKKITLQGILYSKSAKQKIETAGGTIKNG